MEIVICLLMTLGVKLGYYFATLIIKGESKRSHIYGIAVALASYVVEVVELGLDVDFSVFTKVLVGQQLVVAVALVVYLWLKNINRNKFNITVAIAPFVLVALMNYSRLEGEDVVLMVISWILGGAFCSVFLYIVCGIPDKKKQDILLRQIKDEQENRENQIEIARIYEEISQKCVENIDMLTEEIRNRATGEELDDKIKQSVDGLRVKEYCSNIIVNQIIHQMKKRCTDFAFEVDVDVNMIIKVDDLSMSSVLSNLLDNAYNYCEKDTKTTSKYIKLAMNANGDYLTIKVINSYAGRIKSDNTNKGLIKEHGWGRLIVNDIAEKYNGEFKTTIGKKSYEAKVILCCSEEKR